MISIDENNIAKLEAALVIAEKKRCINFLKDQEQVAVILDCKNTQIRDLDLADLNQTITAKEGVLVLLDTESKLELDRDIWNIVPTLQEAFDFISFERMQRDLGF